MTHLPITASAAIRPFALLTRLFERYESRRGTAPDVTDTCARRDFVTRLMAEDPTCVGTEYGMTGMMTLFPRDF